jgi:GTP diphosphokinase / guanosine-3',5'-bis(diphosphate) 3'-diphosphatase
MEAATTYNLNLEEENKLILKEYTSLLRLLKPRLKTKADKDALRKAFEMAVSAHENVRRKSGEPYILHPLAVAKIVVEEIGLGVRSTIASLLHDTVEDTELTLEDIKDEFGNEITNIIDGLTKINSVNETDTTTQQTENFRKVLYTITLDPRVVIIKIADRLHNMRTMESMPRHKQLKISAETSYLYAPLAHRLGFYEISSELNDLCLMYTQPEVYKKIEKQLQESKKERDKLIRDFIRPIKEELDAKGYNTNIFGRVKSISSIQNKIETKEVSFEEIFDIFAIRVIIDAPETEETAACWDIYNTICKLYRVGSGRLRDWLSQPKGNGYKALHNTFITDKGKFVEVQIRSKAMNESAEKGIAAHWRYKEGEKKEKDNGQYKKFESKLEMFMNSIKDMLKNFDTNSIIGMQDLKKELFKEEMYAYTPKGDLRVLPVGATVLDFAFDIHSELGRKCIGAKMNYKLVPIYHPIENGAQIEILTSNKQKPHDDWLKHVKSGKAAQRIRYYLKEEKRVIGEEGKIILDKKLKALNINNQYDTVQEIANHFKLPSPLDLHYEIAIGSFNINNLKNLKQIGDRLDFGETKKTNVKEVSKELELSKQIPGKGYELILFGQSSNQIKYKLSNCCNPIQGDDVFGFVSSGEGLKIHRTNCPNAAFMMANYGHRIVKAKWAGNTSLSFLTAVRITGLDDVGVISKITTVISSDMKINMRSMSIESEDGIFEGTFTVFVKDSNELKELCKRLKKLQGIHRVVRLEADDIENNSTV